MYVQSEQIPIGTVCDICKDNPAKIGVVQQGATGRYCEVMWICTGCAGPGPHLTADEARAKCNADPRGYADF